MKKIIPLLLLCAILFSFVSCVKYHAEATDVAVDYNGTIRVALGGSVTDATIYDGGILDVKGGGTATDTTLDEGTMWISGGGSANGVDLESGGFLYLYTGATATAVRENGGFVDPVKGASITFVENTFSDLTISGESATVHSKTKAINTTLADNGRLYIHSGGTAAGTVINNIGRFYLYSGGVANGATVNAGGSMTISSGAKATGKLTFAEGATVWVDTDAIIDFDISDLSPAGEMLVNNLSLITGTPSFTLTVDGAEADGIYKLAGGATGFDKTLYVQDIFGTSLGMLTVDGGTKTFNGLDYTLNLTGSDLSVTVGAATPSATTPSDIDANGISDVMFQWTGGQGQIGFWMNGTSAWQSTNSTHPTDVWDVLGAYDMNANGKADAVLVGNTEISGIKGAFIGYYVDSSDFDSNWVNISYLTNYEGYVWKNKVGNLTGNDGMNSIVWHCNEIGALGVWTDGTDSWISLGAGYDSNWTLVGCGDFDGTGKDAVVMSYMGGSKYYAIDIDGGGSFLAASDSGWEVRAIADFAGDGRDDIVAFHKETGIVAKWGDGTTSNWSQLGQLDPADWFVAGAGDYNGDGHDDLLVRQYSTGMLGYYSAGDMSQWTELGRGVDMSWTVIA